MPYVLCPSCHRSMLASEYFRCAGPNCSFFALCPACDACLPLPEGEHFLPGFETTDRQPVVQTSVVEPNFAG